MNNQTTYSIVPKKITLLAMLLLILFVGAFLRFYRLDSLPPGLFMDEAINGLDAQDVWRNGRYPIFFPANYGREPIYIYLQAAAMALLGETVLSLRLVSAYAGLLTIPLVYVLGKALFRHTTLAAPWIGLTSAAALAVSYWHVSLSRLGFRTVLLPLFAMLMLLWFWRGWQRRQMRWFVLAGAALGLSQYTYLSARVLPVVLIAFVGLALAVGFLNRKSATLDTKTLLVGLLWTSVIALLIYLPLGVYHVRHAETSSTRVNDVSLIAQAVADGEPVGEALLRNMVLVARMFVDQGDNMVRHNLPDRPAWDWLNAVGFLTGLVLLAWHWRRPESWLLVLWLVVMLLPTILATQAPHYLRASGAVGAAAIVVGVGLVWWWERLAGWLLARGWLKRPFRFWLLLPLLLLTISAAVTAYDYFIRWPQAPGIYDYFEGYDRQAADVARQKLKEGSVYLIPNPTLPPQRSPVLNLLLGFSEAHPLASQCLVYQPQAKTPVTYLVRAHRDKESLPLLQAFLPGGVMETAVTHPQTGEIWFQTYTVYPPENETVEPETAVAQFGDAIQLTDTDVQLSDHTIHITATWQAQQTLTADHTIFLHLYPQGEEDGAPVAQLDIQPCHPSGKWQPGEALRETYTLALPPDLPPGDYTLGLGWYTWPSYERLPLVISDKPLPDQRYQLGQITINE